MAAIVGRVVYVPRVHTDAQFPEELRKAGSSLVIVNFTAAWCGPCKRIAPFVAELAVKHRQLVTILKVDVDECQETAAQYGVRAMPTFMSFRNGVKIEEFSGADPGKLEDTIKRLAGAQAAATGPIAGHEDLKDFIQNNQVECLNESTAHTKAALFTDDGSYLESDCDEQLLITIPFNQNVKIHSVRIKAPSDGTAPKDVRLFVNRPNLGFNEADSEPSIQDLSLSAKDVAEGSLINLKFVRFQNVSALTLFVSANQGGEDTTKINYIEFVGSTVATTKMSDFKRVAGKEGETDH